MRKKIAQIISPGGKDLEQLEQVFMQNYTSFAYYFETC